MHRQLPLMLSWVYKIHKYHGKTLYIAVIDLVKSEKCSVMTLVSLSCVCKLSHFLLSPISLKCSNKFNRSNILPILLYTYAELNLNLVIELKIYSSIIFVVKSAIDRKLKTFKKTFNTFQYLQQ